MKQKNRFFPLKFKLNFILLFSSYVITTLGNMQNLMANTTTHETEFAVDEEGAGPAFDYTDEEELKRVQKELQEKQKRRELKLKGQLAKKDKIENDELLAKLHTKKMQALNLKEHEALKKVMIESQKKSYSKLSNIHNHVAVMSTPTPKPLNKVLDKNQTLVSRPNETYSLPVNSTRKESTSLQINARPLKTAELKKANTKRSPASETSKANKAPTNKSYFNKAIDKLRGLWSDIKNLF